MLTLKSRKVLGILLMVISSGIVFMDLSAQYFSVILGLNTLLGMLALGGYFLFEGAVKQERSS